MQIVRVEQKIVYSANVLLRFDCLMAVETLHMHRRLPLFFSGVDCATIRCLVR